jgi:phytoene synthase
MPSLSPIAALVRRHDPDRFTTVLFAPADRREDVFAVYAFNYEVAKTREVVSEAMLGRIRLQWWREAIAPIFASGPVRRHDVLESLAAMVRRRRLSRSHLDQLIDARERDLTDEPPATLAALEAFAAETAGELAVTAVEILGVREDSASRAARDIGTAYGLTGLLRAVPFHAHAKRLLLPADLVAAAGVDVHRNLFELKPSPALAEVVGQVAAAARRHLEAARELRREIPRAALPALLPGVIAAHWLRQLQRVHYDVFDPRLKRPDTGRSWRLALAAISGRY